MILYLTLLFISIWALTSKLGPWGPCWQIHALQFQRRFSIPTPNLRFS